MSNIKLGENCHFIAAVRHVSPKTNDHKVYHFGIMDEDVKLFNASYYSAELAKESALNDGVINERTYVVGDEDSGLFLKFVEGAPLFALAKNKLDNFCVVKIENIYHYKDSPYKAVTKKLHAPVDYQAAYERACKAEMRQKIHEEIKKKVKAFYKEELLNYMMMHDGEFRKLVDSYKILTGKDYKLL